MTTTKNGLAATFIADEATIKFAQDALAVQDTVNYFAILGALQRHLTTIREKSKVKWEDHMAPVSIAGDSLMKHPCVVLWTDKLASLAGVQNVASENYATAYSAVVDLSNGQDATINIVPI